MRELTAVMVFDRDGIRGKTEGKVKVYERERALFLKQFFWGMIQKLFLDELILL